MSESNAKTNMKTFTIEAYSMPSNWGVPNSSHVFVSTIDRTKVWGNGTGNCWGDSRAKTKQATAEAYMEWLLDFAPPNNYKKCGIEHSFNGVCQTYANREMLVSKTSPSVKNAPKNYVATFFFGKYGMGLNQLKALLTASYNRVIGTYNDPFNALPGVLSRVDKYLDEELIAWKHIAIEYAKMDIDALLKKGNVSAGIATAKKRLQSYINEREDIYQKYLNGTISYSKVHPLMKEAIIKHTDSYLQLLVDIRSISTTKKLSTKAISRNFWMLSLKIQTSKCSLLIHMALFWNKPLLVTEY